MLSAISVADSLRAARAFCMRHRTPPTRQEVVSSINQSTEISISERYRRCSSW